MEQFKPLTPFEMQVLHQIKSVEKELDKLLKIEGRIDELKSLPPMFAERTQELQNWMEVCRLHIEGD